MCIYIYNIYSLKKLSLQLTRRHAGFHAWLNPSNLWILPCQRWYFGQATTFGRLETSPSFLAPSKVGGLIFRSAMLKLTECTTLGVKLQSKGRVHTVHTPLEIRHSRYPRGTGIPADQSTWNSLLSFWWTQFINLKWFVWTLNRQLKWAMFGR